MLLAIASVIQINLAGLMAFMGRDHACATLIVSGLSTAFVAVGVIVTIIWRVVR